ncbi:MAG TPA: hypothetical protein DCY88_15880 [Cyanobacteria bacterium UBA11372]|nr:hypothetical protein [Cyanobacteria bacterium UBA11372]
MLPNQSNTSQSLLSTSEADNSLKIEENIIQDSWRQACFSYKATVGFIIASAVVNILGIGLLFFGKVPEGTITTASGLTTNIVSVLIAFTKENNDRLDRLTKQSKDED